MEALVESRHGSFSSSNAWKLMTKDRSGKGFGAPALKYIKQVRYERRLGLPINNEFNAKPTLWGKICEKRAFDLIDLSYEYVSEKVRLFHPTLPWSGVPDLKKLTTVGDIKCPWSREVFCDKIEALKDVKVYKEEFPEDYWQHISNAILLGEHGFEIDSFEAIIYCPYKSELEAIRDMVQRLDGETMSKYYWLTNSHDDELPWIPDGGYYKNINVIRFEVPEADKKALTERMEMAGKLLIEMP